MRLERPESLFDRGSEWTELANFAAAPAQFGVVYGPRRAGKSTLVSALAEASGGIYYEAARQDAGLSLAEIGEIAGRVAGLPPVAFNAWTDALDTLLSLPDTPVVILDEFGYLAEVTPSLPSLVQRALDRRRRTGAKGPHLIVCGSSIAQLSRLLDRDQPLFGRAQLSLVVDAFDHRTAAAFWGVDRDPDLAFLVHAVLGGLPGYRDVVIAPPDTIAGFDEWITSTVVSPSSPLLEEDALILGAAGLEAIPYRSILASVARGDRTPTAISSRTGRPAPSLARPVESLVRAGLLRRVVDPLRPRRSRYELADPFLAFHDAIIRAERTRIRRRQQADVWRERQATYRSRVLGPQFERLCRETTERFPGDLGIDPPALVGATVLADPTLRSGLEIDVLAVDAAGQVIAIGEAKYATAPRTNADFARLERARELLPGGRVRDDCRLLLFAAAGCDVAATRLAARRADLEIVDLARTYGR